MYVLIIYTDVNRIEIMKEYIGGFSLYIYLLLNSPIKKHLSRQCIEKLWIMNINRAEILGRTPEEHIKELRNRNVVYYTY